MKQIGDCFEYDGHRLKVVHNPYGDCDGCFFDNYDCDDAIKTIGSCYYERRDDNKNVIFQSV